MFENFYKLDLDKQKIILDNAMLEFSKYGYNKTSISQIAKAANISKSMVFHYFTSKQDLYNFLVEIAFDNIIEKYKKIDLLKSLDYIEKCFELSRLKLESLRENNQLFRFSAALILHPEIDMLTCENKEKYHQILYLIENYSEVVFEKKDDSKLRDDIEVESSLKYISWIMDGYSKELINLLESENISEVDLEKYWDEFDNLLENLRKIFYRED